MKLLLVAVSALTVACASATPEAAEPTPPVQTQSAVAPEPGLNAYQGTYALQGLNRVVTLRVWVDAAGVLNGELVGTGNQTTFRPGTEPHLFMHSARDDITFRFTMENGRATAATMRQGEREITGPRTN